MSKTCEAELDGRWREAMPCDKCQIKEVCRYAHHIKRPDYNPDVFEVKVTCKIQDQYGRNDNNGQTAEH